MVFAVIDLGTNTFNLLVAERLKNNTFRKIFNTKIAVKLGEGAINLGYIADSPFKRGIDALIHYQGLLRQYQVEQTYAFATSAIRSASNGKEFVNTAKLQAGISIAIIDGDEEADLIYYGNRMAVKMGYHTSLIMDIGGGSTEFILGNHDTIYWKQSFLLGAARLLEKFNLSNPTTPSEMILFNEYLKQELTPLLKAIKHYKPDELIGSSGAFDSVIDVISGAFNTPSVNEQQTEYAVDLNHYKFISDHIKKSTIEERYLMKGLIGMRVDMMVISILLIDFIIYELQIDKIRVSTFSLKEGVIGRKLGLSFS